MTSLRLEAQLPVPSTGTLGRAWLSQSVAFVRQYKLSTFIASCLCIGLVALTHEALSQRLSAGVFLLVGLSTAAFFSSRLGTTSHAAPRPPQFSLASLRAALPSLLWLTAIYAAALMSLDCLAEFIENSIIAAHPTIAPHRAGVITNALLIPLALPATTSVWLAPALIIHHGTPAVTAIGLSFMAGIKHVRPIASWGRAYMVWLISAALLTTAIAVATALQSSHPVISAVVLIPATLIALALVIYLPVLAFLASASMARDLISHQ